MSASTSLLEPSPRSSTQTSTLQAETNGSPPAGDPGPKGIANQGDTNRGLRVRRILLLIASILCVSVAFTTERILDPSNLLAIALLLTLLLIYAGIERILVTLGATANRLDALDRLMGQVAESASSVNNFVPGSSLRPQRLAEIRVSIRNHMWEDAETLVRLFEETHPGDPEANRLAIELHDARETASRDLIAKIKAAREVNDPDTVLELRDKLKPILRGDHSPLRDLDRDLGRWFIGLIQKRLRSGTVGVDVATLAERVALLLDQTSEGASLRASLPTLRRAAGLCPRCAQPYKGIGDACPACVASTLAHLPKSRSSGTIPAYVPPKSSNTEVVEPD